MSDYLEPILALVSAFASIVAIWMGATKLEISGFWNSFLSVGQIILILISFVMFGTAGVIGLAGIVLLAVLLSSAKLGMEYQSLITEAAAASGTPPQTLRELDRTLPKQYKTLRYLRPRERATLILYLCKRARSPEEIAEIAPHVAALWVINQRDIALEALVYKFDRLLRLWGKKASEAEEVADTLAATAQKSAPSLEELIDGMIAFRSGPSL